MARNDRFNQTPPGPNEIESEIARIQSLNIDQMRSLWTATFNRGAPPALTKDLLARMLAWHIQEQAFGGIDRATLKILEIYVHGRPAESERVSRLKAGTELVREYQRERHTVTVARNGFVWRGTAYKSLTTIARAITGTNWNGPRFFGLRGRNDDVAALGASVPARSISAKRAKEATP